MSKVGFLIATTHPLPDFLLQKSFLSQSKLTNTLQNNTEFISLSPSSHCILSKPSQHHLSEGQICLQNISWDDIISPSPLLCHKTKDYLFPLLCALTLLQYIFRIAASDLSSRSINLIITLPYLKSSKGLPNVTSSKSPSLAILAHIPPCFPLSTSHALPPMPFFPVALHQLLKLFYYCFRWWFSISLQKEWHACKEKKKPYVPMQTPVADISINICWVKESGGHSEDWAWGDSSYWSSFLFSGVWGKAVLIFFLCFMKDPLHRVCISYVSFMLKKKCVGVVPCCHAAVRLLSPP